MSNAFAAFNAGSSSVKFSVFQELPEGLTLTCHGEIESVDSTPHFVVKDQDGAVLCNQHLEIGIGYETVLATMTTWLEAHLHPARLVGIGHRVVHGGNLFIAPVVVTGAVLEQLERLVPLAPLHQPHNIFVLRTLMQLHPELPQIACFDTAFHATNSRLSRLYALTPALEQEGIMRYGFHGLSYEHIAQVLPKSEPRALGKVVVAHLGGGASMCALDHGKSVATTMGFSTLDGLPMGTRCGNLDPGIVLYLLQQKHWTVAQVEELLYHGSGLAGMSGLGADMRQLLASDQSGAHDAVEVFCYRVARELGSLAAALGGLDVLVFTGGIGENASVIRAKICALARWLGVEIDPRANDRHAQRISLVSSRVAVHVLPANEELVIARHTQRLCA